MVNPNRFYTYAYLREDRTPYYIGKGKGDRAYKRNRTGIKPPKDKSRIILLKQNITEEEAFKHEIYMIDVFGRKDLGTGILINRTNGGDGVSGLIHNKEVKERMSKSHRGKVRSEETKKRMSESKKGENHPNYGKSHSEETKRKQSEAHRGEKNYLCKLWKITKITGEEILVWGLNGWSKENNYHHNGLYSVYTGKYKKHKDVIKVEVVG